MCLHVAWKIYCDDDNEHETSDDANCDNGANELIFVVVVKEHAEYIGAVASCENINKYDTINTNNNSAHDFAISTSKDKTLKNGISMIFTLIRQ